MYKILASFLGLLIFLLISYIIFSTNIKLSKESSAKCYQNNKERLQKKACERYQSPSKDKNWQQYGYERHKNFLEDEKQKVVEYRANS